jgi:hypothetical protein
VVAQKRFNSLGGVESLDMGTAESLETVRAQDAACERVPVLALASTLAFAAAGTLLGYSFAAKKRRISVPAKLLLGLVAGGVGAVIWNWREEEIAAARDLMERVHDVRDRRWLKKHPVAYG